MSGEASSYYAGGGGQNGNTNTYSQDLESGGNRHGGYYNNVNYNAGAYPEANANGHAPPPGYEEPAAHKGSVHEVPPNGQNGYQNNQPQPGQPQQQMQMDGGKQDYEQMFQVEKKNKYNDKWAGLLVSSRYSLVKEN